MQTFSKQLIKGCFVMSIKNKIFEHIGGLNISEYYSFYTNTQWWHREDIENLQLQKLRQLIRHCYYNVPFYSNFMTENRIRPEDINSIHDIKLFPIITKEIIKSNYLLFTPTNLRQIPGVKVTMTGGTTGNILLKRNDKATRSSIWATYKRFLNDMIGISDSEYQLILMGGHVLDKNFYSVIRANLTNYLLNRVSFNIYEYSEETMNKIIHTLENRKFAYIRSYSQFLYNFALDLRQRGYSFNVSAVSTTAEPLTETHRKLFSEIFHSETYDQYGCGEIGGISYECNAHKGMHISEERVIIETNENNELLITDLDNFSMPFIRYHNGDQGIIIDEPCECGRNSKRVINLLGRTCDYIIGANGKFLHWAYFWHLFFDSVIGQSKNLRKFQVIQEDTFNLTIKLVCDPFDDSDINNLINDMKGRLGDEMNFTFINCDDIENTSTGKYRPIINKLIV